jgi:hypothetical protein
VVQHSRCPLLLPALSGILVKRLTRFRICRCIDGSWWNFSFLLFFFWMIGKKTKKKQKTRKDRKNKKKRYLRCSESSAQKEKERKKNRKDRKNKKTTISLFF